jgi:hypothetical protein
MQKNAKADSPQKVRISVDEVNRLLDVGHILFSVLSPEEIEELKELLSPPNEIGNAGDS